MCRAKRRRGGVEELSAAESGRRRGGVADLLLQSAFLQGALIKGAGAVCGTHSKNRLALSLKLGNTAAGNTAAAAPEDSTPLFTPH